MGDIVVAHYIYNEEFKKCLRIIFMLGNNYHRHDNVNDYNHKHKKLVIIPCGRSNRNKKLMHIIIFLMMSVTWDVSLSGYEVD